jgi:hypothetical protein
VRDKEIIIGNILKHFPNFIHDELHGKKLPLAGEFGGINVCVREGRLPECNGRIDLAWITDTTIHLAELKRHDVTIEALEQFRRYYGAVQARYPSHSIFGYLIGDTCKGFASLKQLIKAEQIRIMRLGIEMPRLGQIVPCSRCGAGLWSHKPECPYCTAGDSSGF